MHLSDFRISAAITGLALLAGTAAAPMIAATQQLVVEPKNSNSDTRTLKALKGVPGLLESSRQVSLIPDVPRDLPTFQPGKAPKHPGADIATTVTSGSTLAEGVQFKAANGSFLGMSSNKISDSGGVVTGLGLTTYSSPGSSTTGAVQSVKDGSVRMLTVMHGPDAPRNIAYDLKLSKGLRLEADRVGGFSVVNPQGGIVGTISAPWAISADGVKVPTQYTLQGNRLIQTVDHAGAKYPVVADPRISFGRGIYLRYNRGETKYIAYSGWNSLDNTIDATLGCGLLLNSAATARCMIAVMTQQAQIKQKAEQAYEDGKCLLAVASYVGVVYKWKPYSGGNCR